GRAEPGETGADEEAVLPARVVREVAAALGRRLGLELLDLSGAGLDVEPVDVERYAELPAHAIRTAGDELHVRRLSGTELDRPPVAADVDRHPVAVGDALDREEDPFERLDALQPDLGLVRPADPERVPAR